MEYKFIYSKRLEAIESNDKTQYNNYNYCLSLKYYFACLQLFNALKHAFDILLFYSILFSSL